MFMKLTPGVWLFERVGCGYGIGGGCPQASSNAGLCWALPEKLTGVLVVKYHYD